MSKTYLPYDPNQQLLLPAALQEWLPDDHLAYFIPTWSTSWTSRRSRRVTSRKDAVGRPIIRR